MKIEFISDDDLRLKEMLYQMIIFVRSDFDEGKKYYLQGFLEECMYKSARVYHLSFITGTVLR